jgi:hypothetical protein
MAASIQATAVVTSANQLRAHVSARLSPDYQAFNMAGGNPTVSTTDPNNMDTGQAAGPGVHTHSIGHTHTALANVSNNWSLEGDTGGVVFFDPAVLTQFNLVARFGGTGVGQQLGMRITRVTYYGGAAP